MGRGRFRDVLARLCCGASDTGVRAYSYVCQLLQIEGSALCTFNRRGECYQITHAAANDRRVERQFEQRAPDEQDHAADTWIRVAS
jgi:hypothetical protein